MDPRQSFFRINVFARRKIFWMIKTAGGDVDLVRPSIGLVSQRRAVRGAERSQRSRMSFVSMRFDGFKFAVGSLYDHPRDAAFTRRAPAILTMTVRADARLTFYGKANFYAVTSASYHTTVCFNYTMELPAVRSIAVLALSPAIVRHSRIVRKQLLDCRLTLTEGMPDRSAPGMDRGVALAPLRSGKYIRRGNRAAVGR